MTYPAVDPYTRSWPTSINAARDWNASSDWGYWEASDAELRLDAIELKVGIDSSTDVTSLDYKIAQVTDPSIYHEVDHTSTNTRVAVGYIKRTVEAGVGANGCGGYVPYYIENNAGSEIEAFRFDYYWSDCTAASEDSLAVFHMQRAGTLENAITMSIDPGTSNYWMIGNGTSRNLNIGAMLDPINYVFCDGVTVSTTSVFAGAMTVPNSVANITVPAPTAAELTAEFGAPAIGKVGVVDDNNADANCFICFSTAASWWYIVGTKAV